METQRLVSWLMQAMADIRLRSQSMSRLLCVIMNLRCLPPLPSQP